MRWTGEDDEGEAGLGNAVMNTKRAEGQDGK